MLRRVDSPRVRHVDSVWGTRPFQLHHRLHHECPGHHNWTFFSRFLPHADTEVRHVQALQNVLCGLFGLCYVVSSHELLGEAERASRWLRVGGNGCANVLRKFHDDEFQ